MRSATYDRTYRRTDVLDRGSHVAFSVLCVPKQLTEDAWEVRCNISGPSERDSAKQNGAVSRKTELRSAPYERTYRRTNVLDCKSNVV